MSSASTASASPAHVTDIRWRRPPSLVPHNERDFVPWLELGDPVAQRADAQLRARQVLQDRHRPPGAVGRVAHALAVSACSSALPCAKFSRATSIPASIIATSISGSREAGPMVATILVRRMARFTVAVLPQVVVDSTAGTSVHCVAAHPTWTDPHRADRRTVVRGR